jgi:light-regulated signal transduction histidine kinase (bacteriophytochrome)
VKPPPTFDDIFAVMAAASVGDLGARVALPDSPQLDDKATRFAVALNMLLDDLVIRARELESGAVQEKRRAEEKFRALVEALELANRELEALSHSVAHDLRAPLRGMNGFAQLLLDRYADKLDADGQDFLREILLNARKMADLIDGLLSLARVSRGELKPVNTDLSAIAREVSVRLRASEPLRTVEVVVQDALRADVDLRLARAVLENLIGNAWKFTTKGPAARIEFGAVDKNGASAFFVRDNGAGFDMAYANKLFVPFQRLHTVDEFPGTGIGLAAVHRIVSRHRGRIWAEGAVGGGATFYFTLPTRALGTP